MLHESFIKTLKMPLCDTVVYSNKSNAKRQLPGLVMQFCQLPLGVQLEDTTRSSSFTPSWLEVRPQLPEMGPSE